MAYKLTYFNIRGRAESIRILFSVAGVEFEDNRINGEDWPAIKPETPWGQLPYLQVGDKTIAQTSTIARFIARRYNLVGANEFETSKCEELVDACSDLSTEWMKFLNEKDEAKKEEVKKAFLDGPAPKYLGKFDKIQAENGGNWMVGSSVSWADAWISNALERMEDTVDSNLLASYPNLKKMKDSFYAIPNVKAYVAKRA